MMTRALLAFLALPGLVVFAVPVFVGVMTQADRPVAAWALLLLVPGAAVLFWCVREFFVRGKGTLAPWDPPRQLVTSGLYRISRNPIYVGNGLILLGWAAAFRSRLLLVYALGLMVAFHIRVVWFEERTLARTYRDQWSRYSARVPRWIFRSHRAVAGAWLALIVLVPVAGLVYEAYADGTASLEFTPPGTLVDIGGRRLHLLCRASWRTSACSGSSIRSVSPPMGRTPRGRAPRSLTTPGGGRSSAPWLADCRRRGRNSPRRRRFAGIFRSSS